MGKITRRDFLLTSALAGAALPLAASDTNATAPAVAGQPGSLAEEPRPQARPQVLNVALIGGGAQGRVLIESCLRIPGIQFKAVCDIWEYSLKYASGILKKSGHAVNRYNDCQAMLEKEKDLHAVIVASPDFVHAEHTNACLRAGLHVYCEKEMSNSLEKARSMVLTARETKRLLQIGHQRRSNPRYIHAVEKLIKQARLLGRVTHANGQWNRSKSEDLDWPKKYEIGQAALEKYGYDSMAHFRNWRWYRKYGGGPIVDLGSHQIDIFSWVFRTPPKSVMAQGGIDYYKSHEWFDNVMAIYEYENSDGISRGFYQVLTTTKHGGFCETFMGDDGSLQISEVPQRGNTAMREAHAPSWDEWVKKGYLARESAPLQRGASKNVIVDVRVTPEIGKWPLPVELAKPAHQPHLENFFDAIRYGKPLNCPGEIGYETAVVTLRTNEAVESGRKIPFEPKDFII